MPFGETMYRFVFDDNGVKLVKLHEDNFHTYQKRRSIDTKEAYSIATKLAKKHGWKLICVEQILKEQPRVIHRNSDDHFPFMGGP